MDSTKKKAIFVGITYENVKSAYIQPLDRLPYFYARKLMENLVLKEAFTLEQCLVLTDWSKTSSAAQKVDVGPASKANVIQALTDIISNANKSGDRLLFYFCGHGATYRHPDTKKFYEDKGHWGLLKTLSADGQNVEPLFDSEFRAIVGQLSSAPKVNLSIFVHACHGGVMFVPPLQPSSSYKNPGIALSSVSPEIPTAIENPSHVSLSDRCDFTVFLIERVVKKLPEDQSKWPTYAEVYAILVDGSKNNKTKDGTVLMPQLYCNLAALDPAKLKFLQAP